MTTEQAVYLRTKEIAVERFDREAMDAYEQYQARMAPVTASHDEWEKDIYHEYERAMVKAWKAYRSVERGARKRLNEEVLWRKAS